MKGIVQRYMVSTCQSKDENQHATIRKTRAALLATTHLRRNVSDIRPEAV